MLKLGLRYDEELTFEMNGVEVKIKVQKNSINWVSVLIDAPREVLVVRESAMDKSSRIERKSSEVVNAL